jgi:cAMP-dependent protein kinase regulator
LILFTISPNHVLFREGEVGSFFYIVKEGELNLTFSGSENSIYLKKGDSFGELALIQKSKRSGTVLSITQTEVYCLEGEIFREIVMKINSTDMLERVYFVKCISIFKGLNNVQITNLAENMIKCEFKDSDIILNEGDQRESLFIIREGQVSCVKNGIEVKRLSSKDYFGEISILFQTKRALSISSVGNSVCFQITQNVLIDILGEDFRDVLLRGICKEGFNNTKFLKHMIVDKYFDKIYSLFKITLSKNQQLIINNNHFEEKKIVIVVQGTLIRVYIIKLE